MTMVHPGSIKPRIFGLENEYGLIFSPNGRIYLPMEKVLGYIFEGLIPNSWPSNAFLVNGALLAIALFLAFVAVRRQLGPVAAFAAQLLLLAVPLTAIVATSAGFELLAAVLFFALGGKMYWLLGLCMAAGATLGGWIGSHTAMRFGAALIRPLLVTLSLGLTARLLWGYFAG